MCGRYGWMGSRGEKEPCVRIHDMVIGKSRIAFDGKEEFCDER